MSQTNKEMQTITKDKKEALPKVLDSIIEDTEIAIEDPVPILEKKAKNLGNKIDENIEAASQSIEDETTRLSDEIDSYLATNPLFRKKYLMISNYASNISSFCLNLVTALKLNQISNSIQKFYFLLSVGIVLCLISVLSLAFDIFPGSLDFIFFTGGIFTILISFLFYYGGQKYFQMILDKKKIGLIIFFLITGIFGEIALLFEIRLLSFILIWLHFLFGISLIINISLNGKGIFSKCKFFL